MNHENSRDLGSASMVLSDQGGSESASNPLNSRNSGESPLFRLLVSYVSSYVNGFSYNYNTLYDGRRDRTCPPNMRACHRRPTGSSSTVGE